MICIHLRRIKLLERDMKWQTKRYGRIPNAEKRKNVAWQVKYSQQLWFKLQLINLSHVLFAANAIFQNSLHHLTEIDTDGFP